MTLWILLNPEKGKATVMPVKDKKRVPILIGELILRSTSAGPRPHRFRVNRDGKEEYRPPEEFIDLLRLSERIMIVASGDQKMESAIIEMLSGFHLKADRVQVCRFCLLKKQFNFVNKRSIKYHNELICEECAKEELLRALRNSQYNYGDEAIERFEQILLRTQDLDRTIGMLNPEELDPELTHFDTIRSNPDESTRSINDLPITSKFKNILLKKSKFLLPVQSLAVDNGLLDGKNQLITSVTATGKTLVGEMAGVENILKQNGKMLYLVPLVALANQKYDDFTKRYSAIGLKTSIRIGSSRIRTSKTRSTNRGVDTDIIVGTYEGLDYLLRTKGADLLGQIGTVVIDEVHMVEDDERGHRVDGLIARLKYVAPSAQFIYLSATVAKPKVMAKKLGAALVDYEHRPVPIERHLVFCPENHKIRLMTKLVRDEFKMVSSKGHKGQTLIFTNSRRNCHRIAKALPISSAAYHAGISHPERKKIERRFSKGELPVVVTTAALAAGVDFPASQVIFESLVMGIEWLSVQEFLQMLGRAGRPDYHDRGIVVLLATPDKRYTSQQSTTEDEMAIRLLKGEMEHTEVDYGNDEQMEEILASAAVTTSKRDLVAIQKSMLADFSADPIITRLKKYHMIQQKGDTIALTRFGSITAGHFLSVPRAFLIRDAVLADHGVLDIVANLEFFDQVYFKYAQQVSTALKINMPSRVFQGASLDILFEGENLSRLDIIIQDQLFDFAADFLTCKCKESPYCGCAEKKFSEMIITLRCEGRDPEQIVKRTESLYGITAYTGDLYGYLDGVVRNLDAVEMIAKAYSKKDTAREAHRLRKLVEG
ncbi:MAG: DEAD/DEAH box helicase [Methanosarcinaceae archaeon]|nr:DEAD/DEAH box helicase [Methanosarcinaceae archaeon]